MFKIKNLENEKVELLKINSHQENQIQSLEEELERERKRLIIELEGFESLKSIINERNDSLSKLNENNKQLIAEMQISFNEDKLKSERLTKELEKEVELKSNVISTMKKKLESLIENEKHFNYDILNTRNEFEEKLKILEKDKLKLHQDFILAENKYKKMIKDLEVLIYKVNLENFNLKDRLENKLQNIKNENKLLHEEKTENITERPTFTKLNKGDSFENYNSKAKMNNSKNILINQEKHNKITTIYSFKDFENNRIYKNQNPLDIDIEIEKIENHNYEVKLYKKKSI